MDDKKAEDYRQIIARLEKQVEACKDACDDFKPIEEEDKGFKKVKVGSFDKGGIGKDNERTQGTEFIWYRG